MTDPADSPAEPRCKFSRKAVEILNGAEMEFGSFDILTDDGVRQALKVRTTRREHATHFVRTKEV